MHSEPLNTSPYAPALMDQETPNCLPQGISIVRSVDLSVLMCGRGISRLLRQELNLAQKEAFLVVELVILRAVFEEAREELQQALAVVDE